MDKRHNLRVWLYKNVLFGEGSLLEEKEILQGELQATSQLLLEADKAGNEEEALKLEKQFEELEMELKALKKAISGLKSFIG